ncbi:hypothetical protein [Streptomyces cinnamoneus]|uniref:Uncharacterized protein n=1 Tax=Streptomyces cinnamoneus TaxID=53446 RepID=A0A918TU95_STRCJ|nr:hypothetical protein [Streptomyces cinnamoneus]GHC63641.1 hypothetical protein GCM10010507_46210 [Streptomyces cinnamoneus]
MPKTVKDVTPTTDPESLDELRRDCARMAPHWTRTAGEPGPAGTTPLSLIHGITVPAGSARLLDGMSEYGD